MTLSEYFSARREQLRAEVKAFVENKYHSAERILCLFKLLCIDDNSSSIAFRYKEFSLDRQDYVELLSTVVKHPNIVFHELARYVKSELFISLTDFLGIDTPSYFSDTERTYDFMPHICVEMTTLRIDAKAFLGDDYVRFELPTYTEEAEYENVEIAIGKGKLKIDIYSVLDENPNPELYPNYFETHRQETYSDIDLEEVKRMLKVKTIKGLKNILIRTGERLENGTHGDMYWLIRRLDRHGIRYTKTEGIDIDVLDEDNTLTAIAGL